MNPDRASQVRSAVVWAVVVGALHFALGTRSHAMHGLHILLAALFLVPVIIAAVAFERRGGLVAAAAVSAAYLLHLIWSWRGSPLGNADQYAWLAVYPVVGLLAGHLVHAANFRKWQRDQVIARSRHAEMINGLTGLLTAFAVRDEATVAHCRRVANLATTIGEELGFGEAVVTELRLAGLLHDVGKTGIPDTVLFKRGRLDEDQKSIMREHVELAESMLRTIPGAEPIARLVAQHHEFPDGGGYPRGLTREAIDPAAAVLRVADVYSALTERRPYHDPMSSSEAIGAMSPLAGTKLDAKAFAALRRVVEKLGAQKGESRENPV